MKAHLTHAHRAAPRLAVLLAAVALCGAKCTEVDVTDPRVRDTVAEINATFQHRYRALLDEIGTRHFEVGAAVAMEGMRRTLESLGFEVINSEGDYYLCVTAPAPSPLDENEWAQVVREDGPLFKEIAVKHLGLKGNFAELEPEGLNIDGIITFLEKDKGVDVSITFKMRQVAEPPPESILPRRDYAPPAAVRIAYGKIWRLFEERALPIAAMSSRP